MALALVANAFVAKEPHLIADADNMFEHLQLNKVPALQDLGSIYIPSEKREIEFSLERGLCSLLVGKLDDCRLWLGLDSDKSLYRNPSIVDFVLENSKDADDNDLRGLCKLLETWLAEVVFPRFRDTSGIQFKLGDYYDDPTVLRYLERLEGNGSSPLAAAAAIVRIGATEATAVLDHVKASAIQALEKVFPLYRDKIAKYIEDGGTYDSVQETEESPTSDQNTFAFTTNGLGSSDETIEEQPITDKIKDVIVKFTFAGLAIGLVTLVGLKYFPARNISSVLRKEIGSFVISSTVQGPF